MKVIYTHQISKEVKYVNDPQMDNQVDNTNLAVCSDIDSLKRCVQHLPGSSPHQVL